MELTDLYTKAAFLDLTKRERKVLEDKQLLTKSKQAQTVKYADLIYNINWMVRSNTKKLKKYSLRNANYYSALVKAMRFCIRKRWLLSKHI